MRLLALFLLAFQGLLASASETPVFADKYVARGRILLPYAEIDEPFTAWYDASANKSRVDYYGDLVQTVQRADLRQLYKLSYFVNEKGETARVCFKTSSSHVPVQSVLPDLSPFELKAKGACRQLSTRVSFDGDCEAWEYRVTLGQKNNRYLFILRRDQQSKPIPVYYLMMGRNTLMGSHYDKYEILYESYSTGTVDTQVFDIYTSFKCTGYSQGGPENLALMNPIREFIHGQSEHIEAGWKVFQAKHNKVYTADEETHYRENIFRQNYRFIASHNRQSTSYQVAINHLADRSEDELRALRGRQVSEKPFYNGGLPFDKTQYNRSAVPSQWDWRLLGAVNPVKDQAICGSCWAFGTIGTIEGTYFVKTGHLPVLSQQQLVDCSWPETNHGCAGGMDYKSYAYLKKVGGISTEEEYGAYLGLEGKCHDKEVKKSIKVTGFYNVTQNDAESLKVALINHGPVTVGIDASPKSFSFYSHGVYSDPKCSSTQLDHSVLAVGYGEINEQKYWLIKNSWSSYYGNDGYLLIAQKDNVCGVLTDATFPIVE